MDTTNIPPQILSLLHLASENRLTILIGLLIILLLVLIPYLPAAYRDYRAWHNSGAGGVPHNLFGYLMQSGLRPLASEPFTTTCYSDPKILRQTESHGSKGFLNPADIPARSGTRPKVGHWAIPHRQLTDRASEATTEACQAYIKSLAVADPARLAIREGALDVKGPALFKVQLEKDALAQGVDGEIAHVHDGEGSVHVMLAPPDAKLVIERGWGQRYWLSGKVLYSGFLMVYAPREDMEGELAIVEKVIKAGVEFMLAEAPEEEDEDEE